MTAGPRTAPARFAGMVLALSLGWGSAALARIVKPCTPGEPAHVLAARELEAIDRAVRSLAPGGNPDALVARIEKLASTRCFATLATLDLAAKSGLSLSTYWQDGGFSRLEATLGLGGKGRRMFWTEPSVRRALTLETAPTSPIAGMLCPAADEACGAETEGWELRANALFELAGKIDRLRAERTRRRESAAPRRRDEDDCEAAARAAPGRKQFAVWRDCIEAGQEETSPRISLPIGRTRAPQQGWLVVEGRRGHYEFCDETRAYDLATGSAYLVGSCSALALESNGSVDVRKTDAARRAVVAIGHLQVNHLREAVWMAVLLDELDRGVRAGSMGTEVPRWLDVSVDDREPSILGSSGKASYSTDQTQLDWEIVGGTRLVKRGTLTFPDDRDDVAADHAVRLLRIAELSFRAGCPETLPPVSLTGRVATAGGAFKDLWAQALTKQAVCNARSR